MSIGPGYGSPQSKIDDAMLTAEHWMVKAHELQAALDAANARIAQLEAAPPTTIDEANDPGPMPIHGTVSVIATQAPPTSEEVERVASELTAIIPNNPSPDDPYLEHYQTCDDAAIILRRLDRERQAQDQRYISAVNGRRDFRQAMAEWKRRAEAAEAALAEARKDQEQLREHIADIHNRVRHELYAEIEAAQDKAFKAMSGSAVLRAAIAREGK